MPFGVLIEVNHATAAVVRGTRRYIDTPLSLLPQNLLDLTDFFLNIAGDLFDFSFGPQLGIIGNFPGHLPDLTFQFVKLSFRLVPGARFHGILL